MKVKSLICHARLTVPHRYDDKNAKAIGFSWPPNAKRVKCPECGRLFDKDDFRGKTHKQWNFHTVIKGESHD